VYSACLEVKGSCSVGHAARSSCCYTEFRTTLSFFANSTSPSNPLTSMVGEAGSFVFTGALWLGCGTLLCLDRPQPTDELRDYERLCANGEAFANGAMSRLMVRRVARA
jgi:hypothetical protein